MLNKKLLLIVFVIVLLAHAKSEPSSNSEPDSGSVAGSAQSDPNNGNNDEPNGNTILGTSQPDKPPSGKTYHLLHFDVNLSANKTDPIRGDWIEVNLTIKGIDGNPDDKEIVTFKIPEGLSNFKSNYTFDETKILAPWKTSERIAKIIFIAQVSKKQAPGKIILSPDNVTFSNVRKKDGNNFILNVTNDVPSITNFNRTNNDKVFLNDKLNFNLKYHDKDDDILNYTIYTNNISKLNGSIKIYQVNRSGSCSIEYQASEKGYNNIFIDITDGFNTTRCKNNISFEVIGITKAENDFSSLLGNIFIITLIIIIISVGTERADKWLRSLKGILVWIIFISLLHMLNIISITLAPFFALSLYPIIISLTLYFIIYNFSDRHYKYLTIRFISVLGMFTSMVILSYLFQLDLSERKVGFLDSYYSNIIQLFGTILAIVAAFAVMLLEGGAIDKKYQEDFKYKIRTFIIFYLFIIIFSAIGLISWFRANFSLFRSLDFMGTLSLISFECTFLLIIPALVVLYALIDWILELRK